MSDIIYERDRQRLVELLLAYRTVTDVRLYPTIWRVLLLLSSRVWSPEKDARLWEIADGKVVGFAMLWRRYITSPYLVLDWFVDPILSTDDLITAILAWGDQRAREIAAENNTPLKLYTSINLEVKQPQPYVIAMGEEWKQTMLNQLDAVSFHSMSPNPEEHDVYFSRPLQGLLPVPVLPIEYMLRRLQGTSDLVAYQNLYSFAKVAPEHQKELLTSEEYACLVVVDPKGDFSAYCECSICREEWDLTGQRIGWIDYVETKETEKGKGLGRALLLAGLAQLQAWGAQAAMLVTINTNLPAVGLYEKSGFELVDVKQPERYEKVIEP
jgi:ribosomal protein S18 acetylase RimI-like enzyme